MKIDEIERRIEGASASLQAGHQATNNDKAVMYQAATAEALIAIAGCLQALSLKISGEYGVGEQITEGINGIRDTLESKLKMGG